MGWGIYLSEAVPRKVWSNVRDRVGDQLPSEDCSAINWLKVGFAGKVGGC